MRHQLAGNRLGRNAPLRKATIRDMAKATLLHQRIQTTKAKAKEARKMVERLITLGKRNTLSAKRKAFSILCDHQLVSSLFGRIAPRFKERMGGYTRIIPLASRRRGDNAALVFLELTEREIPDVNKAVKSDKEEKKTAGAVPAEIKQEKVFPSEKLPKAQSKPVAEEMKPKPPKKDDTKGSKWKTPGGFKNFFRKRPSEG